jgi:hypothetical protein
MTAKKFDSHILILRLSGSFEKDNVQFVDMFIKSIKFISAFPLIPIVEDTRTHIQSACTKAAKLFAQCWSRQY